MPDLIRIIDLEAWSHLGVSDEEREKAQRLLISLEISARPFVHAASADDIAWTVDYGEIAKRIRLVAAKRDRKLLETLIEEIATELFEMYPIRTMIVEIKKFVIPKAAYVSVQIERVRR